VLASDAPADRDRQEAGPEHFRPTQPAVPSARGVAQTAPDSAAVTMPTLPAGSPATPLDEVEPEFGNEAVVAAEAGTAQADDLPFERDDAERDHAERDHAERDRSAPPRSQFEVAYAEGAPGYVGSGDEEDTDARRAHAETSSPAAPFESSLPPTPVDSEIRWVEVKARRRPASDTLERQLLDALDVDERSPAPSDAASASDEEPVPASARKQALH
jgi:hypothetical protein